jgi:hypothetical protein
VLILLTECALWCHADEVTLYSKSSQGVFSVQQEITEDVPGFGYAVSVTAASSGEVQLAVGAYNTSKFTCREPT